MQKKSFLILLVVLVYLIFILDIVANQYFLYWRFWWFDIVMHFLGGFWIALLSYYLFFLSNYFTKISKKVSVFAVSLTIVLVIGILWEAFEYIMKVSIQQSNYILDTSLDLLMDTSGWLVAYIFLLKVKNKSKVESRKSIRSKVFNNLKHWFINE